MKTATSRWFQNQQQSCGCENIQQLETTRISHLHASTTFMLLLLKDGWNSLKILWPSVKGHYSITKQDHACIRPSCSHLHAPLNRMLHKAAAIIRKITLKFWLITLRKHITLFPQEYRLYSNRVYSRSWIRHQCSLYNSTLSGVCQNLSNLFFKLLAKQQQNNSQNSAEVVINHASTTLEHSVSNDRSNSGCLRRHFALQTSPIKPFTCNESVASPASGAAELVCFNTPWATIARRIGHWSPNNTHQLIKRRHTIGQCTVSLSSTAFYAQADR